MSISAHYSISKQGSLFIVILNVTNAFIFIYKCIYVYLCVCRCMYIYKARKKKIAFIFLKEPTLANSVKFPCCLAQEENT